jgi:nicotinamide-nucleotide adenylyltransferase
MKQYKRVGMVARWRPVHVGQAHALHALCDLAETAVIGVGSSNRYNVRNPFTVEETTDMLVLALDGIRNYQILSVSDLDDGRRWRGMILDLFGELDRFVTDNPYVADLLKDDYTVIRPVELIAPQDQVRVDGASVRAMMARGEAWQAWVPDKVARYIQHNQLDKRFRKEFGLETLALQTIIQ